MKYRAITQQEMADELGISVSCLCSKLNVYDTKLSIYELKVIADNLLMSVDELLKDIE